MSDNPQIEVALRKYDITLKYYFIVFIANTVTCSVMLYMLSIFTHS